MALKPLPQAVITAASLRKMARELLLQAEELEAIYGMTQYQGKKHVEFEFSARKRKEAKT